MLLYRCLILAVIAHLQNPVRYGGTFSRQYLHGEQGDILIELVWCCIGHYEWNKAVSKGFKPMVVPDLVRQSTMEKCGFQPRAENTQVYSIANSELCLAGTAEILLGRGVVDTKHSAAVASQNCVRKHKWTLTQSHHCSGL
jgi:hypothetical protein